jgi:RNA polymerase sigma-70 factor (ECF subfamily)
MTPADRDELSDEALLRAARSDRAAFAALYRRYVTRTVRFAVRRCATPEEAHDLVAAVWLELIEALPRYDSERGSPVAWILGIATTMAADRRRRRAREAEALRRLGGQRVLDGADLERLESAIDAHRIAPALLSALEEIPPAERAALELVALEGLSQRDAARCLRVSDATLRMRLARGRRHLRARVPQLVADYDDRTDAEVSRC